MTWTGGGIPLAGSRLCVCARFMVVFLLIFFCLASFCYTTDPLPFLTLQACLPCSLYVSCVSVVIYCVRACRSNAVLAYFLLCLAVAVAANADWALAPFAAVGCGEETLSLAPGVCCCRTWLARPGLWQPLRLLPLLGLEWAHLLADWPHRASSAVG